MWEEMTVKLPEDAAGREIPPDTEVPCGRYGFKDPVEPSMYAIRTDTRTGIRRVKSTAGTSSSAAGGMHPAEPDSREKPGEDLHAAGVCGDPPDPGDPVCAYAHDIGEKCAGCKPYAGGRTVDMREDTASRINEPRSESK